METSKTALRAQRSIRTLLTQENLVEWKPSMFVQHSGSTALLTQENLVEWKLYFSKLSSGSEEFTNFFISPYPGELS